MNTPIVPTPATKKYKHLLFGIVILISGIIIGFAGGTYFAMHNMMFFRPADKRITRDLSERICMDYPGIKLSEKELNNILLRNIQRFHDLREETSYKIIEIQQDLANEISGYMPDEHERERWLGTYTKYFPSHARRSDNAKRYMKHHCQPDGNELSPPFDKQPPPPPCGN